MLTEGLTYTLISKTRAMYNKVLFVINVFINPLFQFDSLCQFQAKNALTSKTRAMYNKVLFVRNVFIVTPCFSLTPYVNSRPRTLSHLKQEPCITK